MVLVPQAGVSMSPDRLCSSAWCHTVLKVLKEAGVTGLSGQTELPDLGPHGAWKLAWLLPWGAPIIKVDLFCSQPWGPISMLAALLSPEPSGTQADTCLLYTSDAADEQYIV